MASAGRSSPLRIHRALEVRSGRLFVRKEPPDGPGAPFVMLLADSALAEFPPDRVPSLANLVGEAVVPIEAA